MNEKLREIRLYGPLGAKFGRLHRLAVSSTAEAVRALCVILPGFQGHLATSADRGVSYACFIGKQNLREDQLDFPPGDDAIRIAPILQGSKQGGLFQTILGAALVIGATILAPGVGTGAALAAGGWYGAAFAVGASFFLGGVSQMLSPQQKILSAKDGPDNGASYNFNGPVNTTAQGNCRPLLYGRMIVGSAVISAGFFSEDQG